MLKIFIISLLSTSSSCSSLGALSTTGMKIINTSITVYYHQASSVRLHSTAAMCLEILSLITCLNPSTVQLEHIVTWRGFCWRSKKSNADKKCESKPCLCLWHALCKVHFSGLHGTSVFKVTLIPKWSLSAYFNSLLKLLKFLNESKILYMKLDLSGILNSWSLYLLN